MSARELAATAVDAPIDSRVQAAMNANPALAAVVELRKRGAQWLRLTPDNPEIIRAIADGVSLAAIQAMAEAYPDKHPLYVIRAARSDHASVPTPTPCARASPGANTPRPTSRTLSAIENLHATANRTSAAQLDHERDHGRLPALAGPVAGKPASG